MEAGSRTSLPWVVVGVELVVEVRVVQLSEGRQLHLCLTKLVHLNKKSNTGCPHLREGGRERERGREGGREWKMEESCLLTIMCGYIHVGHCHANIYHNDTQYSISLVGGGRGSKID